MEFFPVGGKQIHEECSCLVVPALSIGNVGQLAIDLLVSTLRAEKIGFLDDPNVLPCVGNDAYGPVPQGEIALPLEVYDSSSDALTLVQQRSPVVKVLRELVKYHPYAILKLGMMMEFAKNLADFAASSGKKHMIVLSSLDFRRWRNIDTSSGLQMFYLSSANPDGTDDGCEQLGWKKLPEYDPEQRCWKFLTTLAEGNSTSEESLPTEDDLEEEDYYPSLPFAGLFSCFKAKGLKVTCLFCYCSEGDNFPDAIHLAEGVSKLLGITSFNPQADGSGLVVPLSWKSVYGPPPDISMF